MKSYYVFAVDEVNSVNPFRVFFTLLDCALILIFGIINGWLIPSLIVGILFIAIGIFYYGIANFDAHSEILRGNHGELYTDVMPSSNIPLILNYIACLIICIVSSITSGNFASQWGWFLGLLVPSTFFHILLWRCNYGRLERRLPKDNKEYLEKYGVDKTTYDLIFHRLHKNELQCGNCGRYLSHDGSEGMTFGAVNGNPVVLCDRCVPIETERFDQVEIGGNKLTQMRF